MKPTLEARSEIQGAFYTVMTEPVLTQEEFGNHEYMFLLFKFKKNNSKQLVSHSQILFLVFRYNNSKQLKINGTHRFSYLINQKRLGFATLCLISSFSSESSSKS